MQHAVKWSPINDVEEYFWGKKLLSVCAGYRPGESLWVHSNAVQRCQWKVNIPQAVQPVMTFPRFVIVSEKSRPEVGNRWLWSSKNGGFLGKKTSYGQIFTNVFQRPTFGHGNTSFCANFVKFGRPEVGEIARCLMDKKTKFRLALPLPLLRGSRAKFVRDSSEQYTRSSPNFIQIRSVPAEF